MTKSSSHTANKTGLSPGSLIHVGEVLERVSKIAVIDYSKKHLTEQSVESLDDILSYRDSKSITWVIVEGLTNVAIVEKIGLLFDIHPLVLEDILNTHQRPKFEEYDDYLYIVLKCLMTEQHNFAVNYEQISLLVLDNFVFTFKEKTDNLFQPIIQRLHISTGRIRAQGADYLTYAILDAIVDQNFILIDALDESINRLEQELFSEPTPATLNTIQHLKQEIICIKRNMTPIRELMAMLLRSETKFIHKHSLIYFRDVSDHILRVIESVDSYREVLSSLLEVYISNVSNKMNEVMKVLTVFASIFIPLTFLAGIYGMNFDYMPELKWKWAYPTLWTAFIAIPVVLLIYFKKKKWL